MGLQKLHADVVHNLGCIDACVMVRLLSSINDSSEIRDSWTLAVAAIGALE